jgi:hypothetical protein
MGHAIPASQKTRVASPCSFLGHWRNAFNDRPATLRVEGRPLKVKSPALLPSLRGCTSSQAARLLAPPDNT